MDVATEEVWRVENAPASSDHTALKEFCDRRNDKYGKDPGQALPFAL